MIKTRRLVFNNEQNIPRASTLDGKEYSINEMSDGEKTILYFIIHVLNAKPNSFIVIDEPENHLHYDACITLWNKLEKERKDCTFLYLSHSIDFTLSRNNTTFIWNKNFIFPDKWDIETINDNDLPKKVYLEILGTVPPILYCEGEADSLDKKFYSVIYPGFIIKECGSCNIVKQYKISIQKLGLEKNKDIYAIVDRDLKSEDEIAKCYTKHDIHVLKVLEVENMFFVTELASAMFGEHFEDFKKDYFVLCKRMKNIMINERLKNVLQLKLNQISTKTFMENYETDVNIQLTLENVKIEKEKIESEFESIIDKQDYEKGLVVFDLKNSLFELADRFIPLYKEKALEHLNKDRNLCKLLAIKYIGLPQ